MARNTVRITTVVKSNTRPGCGYVAVGALPDVMPGRSSDNMAGKAVYQVAVVDFHFTPASIGVALGAVTCVMIQGAFIFVAALAVCSPQFFVWEFSQIPGSGYVAHAA